MPQCKQLPSMFLDLQHQWPCLTDIQSLVFEGESWAGYRGPNIHQRPPPHSLSSYNGCPVGIRRDSYCNRVRCEGIHYTCMGCNQQNSMKTKSQRGHMNHLVCTSVASQKTDDNIEAKYITHEPTFAIGAFNLYSDPNHSLSCDTGIRKIPEDNDWSFHESLSRLDEYDEIGVLYHGTQKRNKGEVLFSKYNKIPWNTSAEKKSVSIKPSQDRNSVRNVVNTFSFSSQVSSSGISKTQPVTATDNSPSLIPFSSLYSPSDKKFNLNMSSQKSPNSALDFLNNLTETIGDGDFCKTNDKSKNVNSIKRITMSMSKELEEHLTDLPPLVPPSTHACDRSVSLEDGRFSREPLVHMHKNQMINIVKASDNLQNEVNTSIHLVAQQTVDIKRKSSSLEQLRSHNTNDSCSNFTELNESCSIPLNSELNDCCVTQSTSNEENHEVINDQEIKPQCGESVEHNSCSPSLSCINENSSESKIKNKTVAFESMSQVSSIDNCKLVIQSSKSHNIIADLTKNEVNNQMLSETNNDAENAVRVIPPYSISTEPFIESISAVVNSSHSELTINNDVSHITDSPKSQCSNSSTTCITDTITGDNDTKMCDTDTKTCVTDSLTSDIDSIKLRQLNGNITHKVSTTAENSDKLPNIADTKSGCVKRRVRRRMGHSKGNAVVEEGMYVKII